MRFNEYLDIVIFIIAMPEIHISALGTFFQEFHIVLRTFHPDMERLIGPVDSHSRVCRLSFFIHHALSGNILESVSFWHLLGTDGKTVCRDIQIERLPLGE